MTPEFDTHAAVYEEPPPGHVSGSRLERVLRAGKFAVTAELNPPDSADPADVYEAAQPLGEVADALNATDASGDVLGAAAMGVQNVLCLTGDGVAVGDQPGAKPVFDFDSVSLLRTIKTMRDQGVFLSGRRITRPPRMFLGAAENPCIPPYEWRPERLAKKVAAGAEFIQTNYIYDIPLFEKFMARVRDLGLDRKVYILAGVGPLASAKAARWMRSNVPGIHIPDSVIERVEKAEKPALEGKKLCIELIQQVAEIKGVAGVHVMAYRREHQVSEIILESGILRGRASAGGRRAKQQAE